MILLEKYGPKKLEDMVGNDDIIQIINSNEDRLPQLIFTGPPGIGKTTTAHILKKGYNVLELNASDERGVDTIRNKIKIFCSRKLEKKMIILDEADSLTEKAQQSLRRLLELEDTRFILICNEISKLIEPVQSRCAVLTFSKIPKENLIGHLKMICTKEDIMITEDGLESLYELSDGDMRSALNIMQGVINIKRPIDGEYLFRITGTPSKKRIEKICEFVLKQKIEEGIALFDDLWNERYEPIDLVNGFLKVSIEKNNYELVSLIGEFHNHVLNGMDGKLQFYGLIHDMGEIL